MFANPDKFQAIVVHHNKNANEHHTLKVKNIEIKSTSSVKLLGVEIDNKLKFDNHIASLCKKAANQLNALSRIQKYIGKKEKEGILPLRKN